MKLSLPIKLAVAVLVFFALVMATCLLWTPMRIRYFAAKLKSDNPKERVAGVDGLLGMGEKGIQTLGEQMRGGSRAVEMLGCYWNRPNEPDHGVFDSLYPLHIAAEFGFSDVAGLLLDKGVDIETKSHSGRTPLFYAAANSEATTRLLIRNGADVNSKTYFDLTPLHVAALNGHDRIVKALIDNKARVNIIASPSDRYGGSPLHFAIQEEHMKAIKALLSGGAILNLQNGDGHTPLDMTVNEEIIIHLRARGAKTGEELRIEQEKK